jgi:DNA polymerase-3 subunit gamma/tau
MKSSLAQSHRPQALRDVVGQRHATAVLRRALQAGRLPQQLLFSGGSGLGKTTLARCVAAALLCENPQDGDACKVCESCLDISQPGRIHPDVVEFDAASNGQKEQIKELASRAQMTPQRGKYRVYIIDEAHGLSLGGGQAFLKLLEEPPSHVIFMLATTDPEKMLRTNRGRCVEFELARPTDEELTAHLEKVATSEGWELSRSSAEMVVQATDPALGLRGLLMTLEKLSDTLAWGSIMDESELATLLGLPPTAQVRTLMSCIEKRDRQGALQEVLRIRAQVSDEALRRAVVSELRRSLLDAFSPIAVWRYDQAVNTPAGRLHTEILVCRLTEPELDPSLAALAAHQDEASKRLKDLATALEKAPAQRAAVPAVTAPAAATEAPAPKSTEKQRPTAQAPAAKAPEKPAAAPKPQVAEKQKPQTSDSESDALVRLVAELERAGAKPALAALRASSPVSNGQKVSLSPTEALRKRLDQNKDVLRKAAEKAGVTLSIKK